MRDEDFMLVYDKYKAYGIVPRTLTEGAELDMVKNFVNFRKATFSPTKHKRMLAFLEPQVSMHYPDVVFVEYDPAAYSEWNEESNNLQPIDYKVLSVICSRKQVGFLKLQHSISLGTLELEDSLDRLWKAGDISKRSNCYYSRNKREWLGIRRIETYEAKVDGLEEALQQAIANAGFASESNILLKRKNHPRACTLDRLSRLGIGLMTYDSTGFNRCVDAFSNTLAPLNYSFYQMNDWVGRILSAEKISGEM